MIDYHIATKHHFDHYAKGPETIDWDSQPNPFRRFEGAPVVELPLIDTDDGIPYSTMYDEKQSPASHPWNLSTLSALLLYAMGLAAWKQYGSSRWSLRCNPSSGNLHPTETYVLVQGFTALTDGLYHYEVEHHQLELRCEFQNNLQDSPHVWIGFSSIDWREAWKYGERAYRYCQLDVGHAQAALALCARTLGYTAKMVSTLTQAELQSILGLDRSQDFFTNEQESADLLLYLSHDQTNTDSQITDFIQLTQKGVWHGHANRLDPRHFYRWPIIDSVSKAANKRQPTPPTKLLSHHSYPPPAPAAAHALSQQSAWRLFRQRRSAQSFDPRGRLTQPDLYRLLDRILPRPSVPPWSSLATAHSVHLILYLHAVDGLTPGVYLFIRNPEHLDALKAAMKSDFAWEPVTSPDIPTHFLFFRLLTANARRAAKQLSCHQDIASDGIVAFSMLAEFLNPIQAAAWHYNDIHQEAGAIGQMLYLEAEAIGLRGTGIGCFFDDPVHQLLGLSTLDWQCVYHFTVGLPIVDTRLITLPPY